MPGTTIKIRSREGVKFDGYLGRPRPKGQVPAVMLAARTAGRCSAGFVTGGTTGGGGFDLAAGGIIAGTNHRLC